MGKMSGPDKRGKRFPGPNHGDLSEEIATMADAATIPIPGQKATRRLRKAAHPLSVFNDWLEADGWLSPDTYGREFAVAEDFPAIYMFLAVDDFLEPKFHVAYVGMSTKLASRWAAHPTLRKISSETFYVKRLFKHTPKELLRAEERRYIRHFTPPWNIIGRVAGR